MNSLLEKLKLRIVDELPRREPVDVCLLFHQSLYAGFLGMQITERKDKIDAATINFPCNELTKITTSGFLELGKVLGDTLQACAKSKKRKLHPAALLTSKFILDHEKDHGRLVPEDIQDETVVRLILVENNEQLDLEGRTSFPSDFNINAQSNSRLAAMIFSEPSILSEDDIKRSMHYAELTDDEKFIRKIKKRIGNKKIMLPNWTIAKLSELQAW